MGSWEEISDEELLVATAEQPEAFGAFYRRHVEWMLGFCARRTRDGEQAADLTAEVFAAALIASPRFRPGQAAARTWLFGIALHKLASYERRGRIEHRARARGSGSAGTSSPSRTTPSSAPWSTAASKESSRSSCSRVYPPTSVKHSLPV